MLKLRKSKKQSAIIRELLLWVFLLPSAFAVVGVWFYYNPQTAHATVATEHGNVFYSDTAGAGLMRSKRFTAPDTWGAELNGALGNGVNMVWIQAEWATTREEIMQGNLYTDGALYIQTCSSGCDNLSGDFTARWNNPGTSASQDCDTAPTASTCVRAFDLTYEQLTSRGFVAYADSVGDKFYYALWDGSAWSPDSTPGSPSGTNEVDFHTGGTGGTPLWIRTVASGEQLDTDRSNRIMVLIGDSNDDLFACYWDGSSFSCTASALESSLQGCTVGQCFDGAWQDNNTFIAVYYDTAAATMRYQVYTVGTGWGGEQNGPSLTTAGEWISATSSSVVQLNVEHRHIPQPYNVKSCNHS